MFCDTKTGGTSLTGVVSGVGNQLDVVGANPMQGVDTKT